MVIRAEAASVAASDVVIRLPLRPAQLLRVLVAVSVALATISAVLTTLNVMGVDLPFDQIVQRLDVDAENAVPSWFSTLDLFFCALLVVSIAARERGSRFARSWWLLAAGMAYLSLDETIGVHEFVNDKLAGAQSSASQVIWVVPATIALVIVAIGFVGLLAHLPAKYRRTFVLAGALFVFATIGLETVGGAIVDAHGGKHNPNAFANLPYVAETTTEELLEMIAVAMFACALASYGAEVCATSEPSR